MKITDLFNKVARAVTQWTGSPLAFVLAVVVLVIWAIFAAPRGFDTDSQIPINSITTVITFLMVFLIQNSQNRDSQAFHIKLDELLLKIKKADNKIIQVQDMTDAEIKKLSQEIQDKAKENTVEQVKETVEKVKEKLD